MLILGIDPGIGNLGWVLMDAWYDRRYKIIDAGTFVAVSHRKTKHEKTRTGRRKKVVVPGSLTEAENDMQRCGQIFKHLNGVISERRMAKVRSVVVEDRSVNAVWAAHLKMAQSSVFAAIECAAALHDLPRDLVPVKDVHAAMSIAIPRRKNKDEPAVDAKPFVAEVVRGTVDCLPIDEKIKPASRRVHAVDAAGVVIAATKLEYTRAYKLLEELG